MSGFPPSARLPVRKQALEIPDGEHVALHEPPQPGGRVHEPIDAVPDEPLPGITEVDDGAGGYKKAS